VNQRLPSCAEIVPIARRQHERWPPESPNAVVSIETSVTVDGRPDENWHDDAAAMLRIGFRPTGICVFASKYVRCRRTGVKDKAPSGRTPHCAQHHVIHGRRIFAPAADFPNVRLAVRSRPSPKLLTIRTERGVINPFLCSQRRSHFSPDFASQICASSS